MKTTTVASGPHFDAFVQASILGGRYTNSSEVIQAGLRRLEEDEQRIAALRAAIYYRQIHATIQGLNSLPAFLEIK